MSEANDYKTLRQQLLKCNPRDRIDRIENGLVFGMPDVSYCADGIDIWIEQKHAKEPRRSATPLLGSSHKLSQNQANWILRQRTAGGRCFILVVTDKRWLLLRSYYADKVNTMSLADMLVVALWTATKPVKDIQLWRSLRENLIHA